MPGVGRRWAPPPPPGGRASSAGAATSTRRAPAAASRRAIARPMPWLAPVTIAALSATPHLLQRLLRVPDAQVVDLEVVGRRPRRLDGVHVEECRARRESRRDRLPRRLLEGRE